MEILKDITITKIFTTFLSRQKSSGFNEGYKRKRGQIFSSKSVRIKTKCLVDAIISNCFAMFLLKAFLLSLAYSLIANNWLMNYSCQALCPFCVCVSKSSKMDTDKHLSHHSHPLFNRCHEIINFSRLPLFKSLTHSHILIPKVIK